MPPERSRLPARLERCLRCPQCHGELRREQHCYRCQVCKQNYPVKDEVACLVSPDTGSGSDEGFYSGADPQRYGRSALPEEWVARVSDFLRPCPRDGLALEIGSGLGALDDIHPAYVASDYSLFALLEGSHAPSLQVDAQALPFTGASIDAVITIATLEHVPDPGAALAEIHRCLRPGGRAFLYPAWYVRPWASKALNVTSYRELPWADRVRKMTIPIRDNRAWWAAKVLPGRLARELALLAGRKGLAFSYRRLDPNLEMFLDSDSDAFSSMDPQAAAAYFISRGYTDLTRPTPLRRLLYGYDAVVVTKPAR